MKNNGFTLIELIISIVILGIIGAFTFQFTADSLELYIAVSDEEDIARETRLALERMSREVRAAMNIVSPLAGGSGSTITFDRTPTATDNSIQVTFWRDVNTLRRYRGINPIAGDGEPLASSATGFVVTRNGDLITLDLTLAVSGQEPVQQRTLVYPRYFKYQ